VAVHFEDGPFGLFNVDVYDTSRNNPDVGEDGTVKKPYVVYSVAWEGHPGSSPIPGDPKRWAKDGRLVWVQGDTCDQEGALLCPKETRDGEYALRAADAMWDPSHPEADLKKAKQFLLDLANASHS
jgi:hypothetical protein